MPEARKRANAGTRARSAIASRVARHLQALNNRDLDGLMAFYAEGAVLELPATPAVEGCEAIRRAFQIFFEQWEERSTYTRVLVSDSEAAVEGLTTGRHRTLHLHISAHIPAGSRRYRHAFAAFLSFRDGRIVRHRVYYDARELVRQLLG